MYLQTKHSVIEIGNSVGEGIWLVFPWIVWILFLSLDSVWCLILIYFPFPLLHWRDHIFIDYFFWVFIFFEQFFELFIKVALPCSSHQGTTYLTSSPLQCKLGYHGAWSLWEHGHQSPTLGFFSCFCLVLLSLLLRGFFLGTPDCLWLCLAYEIHI
jgi:hypothetical protein